MYTIKEVTEFSNLHHQQRVFIGKMAEYEQIIKKYSVCQQLGWCQTLLVM